MRILLVTQCYRPETVGPAIWLSELAVDLVEKGHDVEVLTTFPNHPEGTVFPDYRGHQFAREVIDGVNVTRTWMYTTRSRAIRRRAFSYSSFCVSAFATGLTRVRRPDVIYAPLPPLPLGIAMGVLARLRHCRLVVNVQDIYPHAAVALGVLHNPRLIRFFEGMEQLVYRWADHTVVISEGFREDLLEKGVPPAKLSVVPNWADPGFIRPLPKENLFSKEIGLDGDFAVIYSGGLTHNSNVESLVEAAEILRDEPFRFVVVGDGVRKASLECMASSCRLTNITFLPFQPLERYPEVLASADINVVTLSSQAALVSVPSKVYKQMAAARPVLAITCEENELARLVREADCGICVPPDAPAVLAEALRWARGHPEELARMGGNAREHLERTHSRSRCTGMVETVLRKVVQPVREAVSC